MTDESKMVGSAEMPPPVKNLGKKNKNKSSTVQIGRLSISFPFEPYEAQKVFMSKAIAAMESGTNALLESPTGTGKTLCLLCSTLAWRKDHDNMKQKAARVSNVNVDFSGGQLASGEGTVIIYASRTHSQLKQVVSELKNSVYAEDVKMTILGSRDQLCSNKNVRSKNSGYGLTKVCNSLTTSHRCPHKNKLDSKFKNAEGASTWLDGLQDNFMSLDGTSSSKKSSVLDIEELLSRGQKEEVCSFFHSRAATKTADLLLMPYNYLFNRSYQRALSINWHNCVVIIDEAHNIESAACESLSKSFSSGDLSRVVKELQEVLNMVKNGLDPAITGMLHDGAPEKSAVISVLKAVFEIEQRLDAVELSAAGPGPKPSCDKPAEWFSRMLESTGFKADRRGYFLTQLGLMCDVLGLQDIAAAKTGTGGQQSGMAGKEAALVKFLDLLYLSYPRTPEEIQSGKFDNEDSVVYICEGGSDSSRSTTGSDGRRTHIPKTSKDKSWLLNYWCFSAGVALRQLKNLGVRSLLLASGTLSPMGALKADFMLPFPVELENKHVIQDSQIWVAAVGKGPTGGQLNSTMKVRGLSTYKDELGSTIVNICLTMMGKGFSRTPPGPRVNGGVLIFFPTYFVMEDCVKRWKESALWHKLETAGGKVFIEPRAGGDSASASTNASSTNTSKVQAKNSNSSSYPKKGATKTAAATPTGGPASVDPKSAALFDNFISAFESAVKRDGNAVLLAVCQGKVSEGIDFTDEKGRAVIVTGIPYAPVGDAWVILKRRYLDERVHGLIRPAKSSSSSVTMKGGIKSSAEAVYGKGVMSSAEAVYGKGSSVNPLPTTSRVGWSAGMTNSFTNQNNKSALSQATAAAAGSKIPSQVQNHTGAPTSNGKGIKGDNVTGETWYSQTASRAVNQALGRIIRHKNDWGAIFLLDDRFERESQKKHLSSWIRPQVKTHQDFSQCLQSFREFLSTNTPAERERSGGISAEADGRRSATVPGSRVPVDWDRRNRKKAVKASNIGSKKVTVSLEELPDDLDDEEGGISFINPNFFLSQQQNQAPVAPKEKAVLIGSRAAAPPPDAEASKPRSMSEMLKTKKKKDPFALVRDREGNGGQSSSSSGSSAQDLYLRGKTGAGQASASSVSDHNASASKAGGGFDIFNFGDGGSNVPWVKVEEAPPKVPTAKSGAAKQGQQTMLGFMKKRSVSSPPAQPENDPADSRHKKAKQSPLSPDPFDYDNLDLRHLDHSSDYTSARVANIVCGVCRQKDPSDACTSKACGHICCKSCWVSWLRVNKSCPLCKVTVTEESIRGLNFR